jgi:hypothetical protein
MENTSYRNRATLGCIIACSLLGYSSASSADHGSLGFGIGTASPILTQTGVTLPGGRWAAGLITQYYRYDGATDSELLGFQAKNGDVHSVGSLLIPSLFAAYGVTDDLTIGLRLPWVLRSGIKSPTEEGDAVLHQGDPDGFGDVSVFGQYRVFHSADNLNMLSLVVGLKTPTGTTDTLTAQGDVFEVHHQPGSGSWDPSFGFNFTRVMGSWSFDANLLYTFTQSGAQATNLGDAFDYNVAVSYGFGAPVRNAFFSSSNSAPWTAVLELTGTWRDKQTTEGQGADPNSGGNVIYINPGVRFSGGKAWNTALSFGVPIVNDLSGYQTPADYRIVYRFVVSW